MSTQHASMRAPARKHQSIFERLLVGVDDRCACKEAADRVAPFHALLAPVALVRGIRECNGGQRQRAEDLAHRRCVDRRVRRDAERRDARESENRDGKRLTGGNDVRDEATGRAEGLR